LIVEIESANIQNLHKAGKIKELIEKYQPVCIRVKGLHDLNAFDFILELKFLASYYNINIDVCASNKSEMATAIAVEALDKGVEYITSSFCGIGYPKGFARLEEVLMAVKVLLKKDAEYRLTDLVEVSAEFERITKRKIYHQKPILGRDIFKCESGIHVHGILRDPNTYEPYPPEMVGQKREIVVGKHSSRNVFRQAGLSVKFI
jgi:Isopropylmalate/homocitrate/citramalate synthases